MDTIEQTIEQYTAALIEMDAYTVSLVIDEFIGAVTALCQPASAPEYEATRRLSYQLGYLGMLTATMAKSADPIKYLASAITHSGVGVKVIEDKIALMRDDSAS